MLEHKHCSLINLSSISQDTPKGQRLHVCEFYLVFSFFLSFFFTTGLAANFQQNYIINLTPAQKQTTGHAKSLPVSTWLCCSKQHMQLFRHSCVLACNLNDELISKGYTINRMSYCQCSGQEVVQVRIITSAVYPLNLYTHEEETPGARTIVYHWVLFY